MRYKISNWSEYQHYKDRCPPWIKLHHSLITSEVWVMGNDASRALAVACMLLASRDNANDGSFNGDPEYVKRFAYLNSKPDYEHLIKHGFIECLQDASNMLSECNTEKRREEKRQSKEENIKPSALLASLGISESVSADFIALRNKLKAPITKTAMAGIQREASKAGISLESALQTCCERSWRGFKAEWVAPQKNTVQEVRLDFMQQLFGGNNGNDRTIIDVNPSDAIESHGASIPEIGNGLRESNGG